MTECVLCDRWNQTPFARRHTTPTTAQDTEAALVLGFWLAQQHPDVAPRLCERHSTYLFRLDTIEASKVKPGAPQPTQQQLDFQARAEQVAAQLSRPIAQAAPQSPLPGVQALVTPATIPAPPPEPEGYTPPQQAQLAPASPASPAPTVPVASELVATESGKQTFPCPICGAPATSGELHRCEG